MGEMLTGVILGLLWGFVIFVNSSDENNELTKQGAIEVYEGKIKCEKAMNTWVCGKLNNVQNGDQ